MTIADRLRNQAVRKMRTLSGQHMPTAKSSFFVYAPQTGRHQASTAGILPLSGNGIVSTLQSQCLRPTIAMLSQHHHLPSVVIMARIHDYQPFTQPTIPTYHISRRQYCHNAIMPARSCGFEPYGVAKQCTTGMKSIQNRQSACLPPSTYRHGRRPARPPYQSGTARRHRQGADIAM